MSTEHPIINASEHPFETRLYLMWAGQIGTTRGYVWADSCESAFEIWVEYLDEHAPGLLVSHEHFQELLSDAICELYPQYKREQAEPITMCGQTWHPTDHGATLEAFQADHALRGLIDREADRVLEYAERDLTTIGHTSLTHGNHIASHEWGLDEIDPHSEEWRCVKVEGAPSAAREDRA